MTEPVAAAPDINAAQQPLLRGKTSARNNVSWFVGPQRPFLRYRIEGGAQISADTRVRSQRVAYDAYGNATMAGYEQASKLINELDAVLMPPERIVHGFRGWAGPVFIHNVEREIGPSWLPEPETGEARFFAVYLFHFTVPRN